jgi:hypothetical protein
MMRPRAPRRPIPVDRQLVHVSAALERLTALAFREGWDRRLTITWKCFRTRLVNLRLLERLPELRIEEREAS